VNPDDPAPCSLHYLSMCKLGDECRFGHDYELRQEHIEEMQRNAKKGPCPSLRKGVYYMVVIRDEQNPHVMRIWVELKF
jgi:hypothetical protein